MQAQIPPLSLGFSPCPNDTFIFHALVHNLLAACRARFASPILADVETLNLWAMQGRLDVSKVSFHAFGHLTGEYVLLGGGAALGRGCGPLLVAAKPLQCSDLGRITVAIPGEYTTAAMLLRLFAPHCTRTVIMPFHRIMPAMVAGEVDGGVSSTKAVLPIRTMVCIWCGIWAPGGNPKPVIPFPWAGLLPGAGWVASF